ncbi:MAG: FAD-containing monooxygenase EthA [Rhodococcus erythropolis]|jgi:cation diffusion facilitator CzcD-associated flavoprotein CzcO|uniref:flavin-containing monooxygenase n=1 Tax=Rhodococcus sp. IEGM 1241 TaxID=3082228 RepID=UPI00242EFFD2|nr:MULTISPECIES: NAD(P)/FAD-dependent oxidoreductase [Rhodococcus]MDF2893805.1 FAD-containing monooxygenase EthA [Rhodococcus erythropolis]MDV8010240.1 NAD(P)/FAD-dependent oxidoreductase [Rhodococcus sp. IEGM 1241]
MTQHVDVLIIGAGLSGIGAACHLIREKTGSTYAILERRENIGGTWDLFKYPGIRSDSDMLTFGFGFRPWIGTKVLADGASIRDYVEETAKEYGVTDHINFGRKVVSMDFDRTAAQWTVTVLVEATGETETWTANVLVGACGYYNYDKGYRPAFPGEDDFRGQIVHPQHWPEDLDYTGKKVVVIGSGATAITLIPSMAPTAGHVTMLQRSPTWIQALPSEDPVAKGLKLARVPDQIAYKIGRARNIALQRASFQLSRTNPKLAKKLFLAQIRLQLGKNVDLRHFTPSYNPWDQRLCVVPNGDLFKVLKSGKADIVTDRIATFTEKGIVTESGREIEADVIVTATGLNVQILGGATMSIDGEPVKLNETVAYKSVLYSDIPNFLMILGYTNASWTLKADLAASYLCRVLKIMRDRSYTTFEVHAEPEDFAEESLMGGALTSGYIQRGDGEMPRQGARGAWKVVNNYYRDRKLMHDAEIEDGVLQFSKVDIAVVPDSKVASA